MDAASLSPGHAGGETRGGGRRRRRTGEEGERGGEEVEEVREGEEETRQDSWDLTRLRTPPPPVRRTGTIFIRFFFLIRFFFKSVDLAGTSAKREPIFNYKKKSVHFDGTSAKREPIFNYKKKIRAFYPLRRRLKVRRPNAKNEK